MIIAYLITEPTDNVYVFTHGCMYLWIYVCVCMYVGVYIYTYVCIPLGIPFPESHGRDNLAVYAWP